MKNNFACFYLDCVSTFDFANNLLWTGSFDHTIRSWNIEEIKIKIRERKIMALEDIVSKKIEVFNDICFGKKKKKGKGKKTKK